MKIEKNKLAANEGFIAMAAVARRKDSSELKVCKHCVQW